MMALLTAKLYLSIAVLCHRSLAAASRLGAAKADKTVIQSFDTELFASNDWQESQKPKVSCTSTVGWKSPAGLSCFEFEAKGYCEEDELDKKYIGKSLNQPEENCCACGKRAADWNKKNAGCVDTPDWNNNVGFTCTGYSSYESTGRCRAGAPANSFGWTLGWKYNNPEKNCCACGKRPEKRGSISSRRGSLKRDSNRKIKVCTDTPDWKSTTNVSCVGVNSYESHRWCEDGNFRENFGWTKGKKFNFPERNCCICGKQSGNADKKKVCIKQETEEQHHPFVRMLRGLLHFEPKITTKCFDPQYSQRSHFISNAATNFKVDGHIQNFTPHVATNREVKQSIQKASTLLGWHNKKHKCFEKVKKHATICGAALKNEQKQSEGAYDDILVAGSNGSYCMLDEKSGVRRMSLNQITALKAYTWASSNGNFHETLNDDLHNQRLLGKELIQKKWSVFMYYFLTGLDCIDATKSPTTLYRGINVESNSREAFVSEFVVGKIVTWTGVTSTTPNLSVARDIFATKKDSNPDGAVIFTIQPKLAYNVKPFSMYENEDEYIIPPMSQFKVTEMRREKHGIYYIHLYQLDHLIADSQETSDKMYIY